MSIEYIFSINTGRSGSDYLTELFAQTDNAVSIHEGVPIMNGEAMRAFNNGDRTALAKLMPLKMREIQKKKNAKKPIYCETNHSFIKGWGYLLPDAYIPQEKIAVIILRRDPEKIARSLLRIHNVPGATSWTRTWWLTPGASGNLSRPAVHASALDLCRWYVDETELRAREYQRQFPRIRYIECELAQLNDLDFVRAMFADLGLQPTANLARVCGRPLNEMNTWPALDERALHAPAPMPAVDAQTASRLIPAMIGYLQQHHRAQIDALQTQRRNSGENSLAPAVAGLIARSCDELERQFDIPLRYSELECALVWNLLATLAPFDLLRFFAHPRPDDFPFHDFDFNRVPTLPRLIQRFGLKIVPALVKLGVANQSLDDDRSHRRLSATP